MTYEETLEWMFLQLPMYQKQGAAAYKKDLTNTIKLVNHLNNPERRIKTIHVAGTNGKGSTSSMISSILQEAGYKVGLYTSPHLKDYRERIKINGEDISREFVVDFISENKKFFTESELSFFEMTVGMAFSYFEKEKVDVAVIEVGLGGRLDSTNIISPLVSVITNIGIDHTAFLGSTIEDIALEKAGIIKYKTPIVIGEYTESTKEIFINKANELEAPIYFASDLMKDNVLISDLSGPYQANNIRTVRQTINILRDYYNISEENEVLGLLNVAKNTKIKGRWQILNKEPKVIVDSAHNAHGLEVVMNQLKNEHYDNLFIVLGVVNDKNLDTVLPLFPQEAKYFFCKPNVPRGLDAEELSKKAEEYNLLGYVYNSVSDAYKNAMEMAATTDLIYVGGSTFVVAEIL